MFTSFTAEKHWIKYCIKTLKHTKDEVSNDVSNKLAQQQSGKKLSNEDKGSRRKLKTRQDSRYTQSTIETRTHSRLENYNLNGTKYKVTERQKEWTKKIDTVQPC